MRRSCLNVSILIVGYIIIKCHCFVLPSHCPVHRHFHTYSDNRGELLSLSRGGASPPEQEYDNDLVAVEKQQQKQQQQAAVSGNDGTVTTTTVDLFEFDRNDVVSDAEALLACRAYLQRKNRLGWHRAEERKALREQSAMQENGFFWETSEQSAYRNKREEEDIDFDQGEDWFERVEQVYSDEVQEQPGIFTEMPTGPNERSEIRSRVKKEQWQDAQFRERWYEARWGDHIKPTEESKKQLKLQTKLLEIPTAILNSPEFAMLTEDEIDEAIISYVVSNRKRSAARKKKESVQPRDDEPPDGIGTVEKALHRDSLFSVSEDFLREQQRKRSERAKKAYQTRMESAAKSRLASTASEAALTLRKQSPKKALLRIVADLDADVSPSLEDVKTMMKAIRLSRRKDVLRRILKERFEQRGKCSPSEDGPAIYMTGASVVQLGQLVIKLLTVRASKDSTPR